MTLNLSEIQLWQRNAASLIRSGLFTRAEVRPHHGLHVVVGVYKDETESAPLAKYADVRRAHDAADMVNSLAEVPVLCESN